MAVNIRFDLPGCEVHEGALAMPSKAIPRTGPQEMQGGIFTHSGEFIGSSALIRGVKSPIMAFGKADPSGAETVRGRSAYGGFLYRGHYGHFLIESLSRMWRLMRDGEFDRIFFHSHPGHSAPCKIGEYIFEKIGIDISKISVITKPTLFESIVIPETSFRLGGEDAHLVHRQVFAAIADGVCGDYFDWPASKGKPVYFSRTKFRVRPVFGEEEIESELKRNDWNIVYPEHLSVEDQIKSARSASVVCGVIGSAMHNLMFSRPGTKAIYIEREPSQQTTYRTLSAQDRIFQLDPLYVPANLKSHSMAGPFLIDPNVVLNSLYSQGLIARPQVFDVKSISERYEKFVSSLQ